jgi:hypothetical protein
VYAKGDAFLGRSFDVTDLWSGRELYQASVDLFPNRKNPGNYRLLSASDHLAVK